MYFCRVQGITRKFYFDKKGGNSLPEFPRASEMVLDTDMSTDKVGISASDSYLVTNSQWRNS